MRGFRAAALLLVLAAMAKEGPAAGAAKMRGVCWEGAGPIESSGLAPLKDLGATWISQTPFGWMSSLDSAEVRFSGDGGMWGETDEGLAKTAAWARTLGIKTLLKPHLWVRHGAWQGDLAMQTEEAWAGWFASYESFVLHYAKLAETNGFEALAIGTELGGTTGREKEWRALIAKVRAVYHGKVTYAANWSGEAEHIAFWDSLDFIGIQAYYPLCPDPSPSSKLVLDAWRPIVAKLAALSARTGKPVVFTEVGYKANALALKEPWRWDAEGAVDLEVQRRAFDAMFQSLWPQPWFGGTFVWKWHPNPSTRPRDERDFTPQGKPALEVIRSYYRGH